MKKIEIEKKIRFWFKKKNKKLNINENFLNNNNLDSFDMIEFITFLEKEYEIKFKAQDYQNPDFATIKNISKLIQKYKK
tara:strand:+ start:5934 stop:6170 length:237 start_codon:yes stop_codon:yes gene_type:complete